MKGLRKEKPEIGAVYREDLEMPAVGRRDILVEVKAAAICGTDQHIYHWTDYCVKQGIPIPMVFGHEFSGVVVKVGEDVTEVKVGDHVAAETHIPCNHCTMCKTDNRHICNEMKIIGVHVPGCFSDYAAIPVDCAYVIPDDMDFQYGAMLEPMGVAVHGVDEGRVADKTVVIYGCGPIGLMAVAAAKGCGAKYVIAIDVFDNKLKVAEQVGADMVVNSKTQSTHDQIFALCPDGVDVAIDYTGNHIAIRDCFHLIRKGGRVVLVGLPNGDFSIDLSGLVIYKEATIVGVTGRRMYQTWEHCDQLLTSGAVNLEPIIGGVFPLKDYDKAFAQIFAGAPGKMLLIP